MFIARFKPEDVAGQVEGADLPASIAKNLVGPDRTADNPVHVVRRLVLAIDLGIAAVRHRGAHQADRIKKRTTGYARSG
jgi:hypothetical protein